MVEFSKVVSLLRKAKKAFDYPPMLKSAKVIGVEGKIPKARIESGRNPFTNGNTQL
jgi:hypothetical protein